MLKFTDTDTAAKFECLVEADRMAHKAGLYMGMLSNITPGMASAMVKGGSNLVKEKQPGSTTKKAD